MIFKCDNCTYELDTIEFKTENLTATNIRKVDCPRCGYSEFWKFEE